MDTVAKFIRQAEINEEYTLTLSTEKQFSNSIINGTKNNAKEIILMMWFGKYDKNGCQNAHGHSSSQEDD